MTNKTLTRLIGLLTAAGTLCVPAWAPVSAQPGPEGSPPAPVNQPAPATEPAPEVEDLLRGPTVPDRAKTTPGLGSMMAMVSESGRLDAPVAEIAALAIELSPEDRAKVEAVLLQRAKDIDAFVTQNRDLITELMATRPGGRVEPGQADEIRRRRREATDTARRALAPVLEKGPLEDQVAAVLPADKLAEYRRFVTDFTEQQAVARQRQMPAGGGGFLDQAAGLDAQAGGRRRALQERLAGDQAFARRQRMQQEFTQILTVEVPRSYKGIIDDRRSATDDFIARLGVDAETGEKIRGILIEGAQARASGDSVDRREQIQRIAELLTPEQRQMLREIYRQGRGPFGAGGLPGSPDAAVAPGQPRQARQARRFQPLRPDGTGPIPPDQQPQAGQPRVAPRVTPEPIVPEQTIPPN